MWLETYFFRRTTITYFIPIEPWSGRKIIKSRGVSQSESMIVKIEMDRNNRNNRKNRNNIGLNKNWGIKSDNE